MRVVFSNLQSNRFLPRNPLLRALLVIVGALMLIGLLFFGLIAGAALIAVGAIALMVRRWLPRKPGKREDGIIDGEFRVIEPARESLPRAGNR